MRRSPVYEAAQSLIDEVAEAARKVAAWSPEKRERVRLEGGAMSASAYIAKVEADPRRAAALQRARDRAAAGVATRHPRCGYPYCACVGQCFAASQPGAAAGVREDGND